MFAIQLGNPSLPGISESLVVIRIPKALIKPQAVVIPEYSRLKPLLFIELRALEEQSLESQTLGQDLRPYPAFSKPHLGKKLSQTDPPVRP